MKHLSRQPTDNAFVIRHPKLVRPFRKKALTLPPDNLDENFKSEKKQMAIFAEDVRRLLDANKLLDAQKEFYRAALSGFTDSKVGIYSGWCDNAVAVHGYNSPEAIRLAYMYVTQLLRASRVSPG